MASTRWIEVEFEQRPTRRNVKRFLRAQGFGSQEADEMARDMLRTGAV
jgi:hypothetical protein